MKKWNTLLIMMLVAAFSVVLTGCETDDYDQAQNLWGVWEGNLHVTMTYGGTVYKAYKTVIRFDYDEGTYSSGTGYEIDYYRNAFWGRDYAASRFTWTVRNGNIYIYYTDDDYNAVIREYTMQGDYFEGYIDGEDNSAYFRLIKTASPYRWDTFRYGWHYNASMSRASLGTDTAHTGLSPKRGIASNLGIDDNTSKTDRFAP